jgi:hypothetical protein
MGDFRKWLNEAKKEINTKIVGFCVRWIQSTMYVRNRFTSPTFKTYEEAVKEQERIEREERTSALICAVYSDKSMRPLHSHFAGTHFYNSLGDIKQDQQMEKKKSKMHALHAKNDSEFKFYLAMQYINRNVINRPRMDYDELPEGLLNHIQSAFNQSLKEKDLVYIGQLIDFIQEKYDTQNDVTKNVLAELIHAYNNSSQDKIPYS